MSLKCAGCNVFFFYFSLLILFLGKHLLQCLLPAYIFLKLIIAISAKVNLNTSHLAWNFQYKVHSSGWNSKEGQGKQVREASDWGGGKGGAKAGKQMLNHNGCHYLWLQRLKIIPKPELVGSCLFGCGGVFLPWMVSGDKDMVSRQNFVWTRMWIERKKKITQTSCFALILQCWSSTLNKVALELFLTSICAVSLCTK